MTMVPRPVAFGALAFVFVAVVAPALPAWLVSLTTLAFANALVVLGLIILWRAGLVPFGQALFYAIGAYAVALIDPLRRNARRVRADRRPPRCLSAIAAFLTGFLLARYREIFFAMLSLAMSMILYGVLVKTETLGSTDGFHVEAPTYLGYAPQGAMHLVAPVLAGAGVFAPLRALLVFLYFRSVAGALAVPVRDNEIRLEFLGVSVNRLIHLKLVIAGTLGRHRRRLGRAFDRARRSKHGVLDHVRRLCVRDHSCRRRIGRGSFRRLVRVRAFKVDRLRHLAGHLANLSRRGAARHHPVPARGARLAVRSSATTSKAQTNEHVLMKTSS